MMEWEFTDEASDVVLQDDIWYSLTCGGYLKPEEVLKNPEQIKKLKDAIAIVESFQDAFEEISEEC